MSPRPATMQIRPLEDHELENQTISHRPYTYPSCFRGGHHFDGVVRRGPPGGADGDLRQDQPRAAVRVRGKDTAGEPGGPEIGRASCRERVVSTAQAAELKTIRNYY